jgi:hypothetical protein
MFSFLTKYSVTDQIYRDYVNTGIVPKRIITLLAKKTMSGVELTSQEFAIFCGLTTEVNDEIKKLAKK